MRATLKLYREHVYQPLIRFLGRRKISVSEPLTPHPHPAAPPEVASHFSAFLKRFNSSAQKSTTPKSSLGEVTVGTSTSQVYHEFWEAPSRYWAPSRQISDAETDAVSSGGASMR